jgi:FAD/FMN-containing dehydrogenase
VIAGSGKTINLPLRSRREFIERAGAAAMGLAAGKGCLAGALSAGSAERFTGGIAARNDPNYELWRKSMIWQRRKSSRYPDVILQADSTVDVVAAVSYARQRKLRIATRCGGHSMSACFLRDGGVLLDVSRLSWVQVDKERRRASVGPGVIGQGFNERLGREGLAFPTAGCGLVPLGGFLLGGGIGLNANSWGGMSTFNIEAAEVVTADGSVIQVSAKSQPDLFWALRGGGPGLFFVVTKLHLRVYDLPKSIVTCSWTFPFDALQEVVDALSQVGPELPQGVDLQAGVSSAARRNSVSGATDLVVTLGATVYSESIARAKRAVGPLLSHPILRASTGSDGFNETSLSELYFQGELSFSQRRFVADNIYTDRPRDVTRVIIDLLPGPHAERAHILFQYIGNAMLPDAACSATGRLYVAYYQIYDDPAVDTITEDFHTAIFERLVPLGTGSYINEMNQEARPWDVSRCYSAAAWDRMKILRKAWDPDSAFQGFFGS